MANNVCDKCNHYDVCLLHEDNFIDDVKKNGFCGKFKTKTYDWISVDEKLPKEDERVIIYIKPQKGLNEHITVAKFIGALFLGGEGYFSFEKVTHWMPLPEPPKEQ